MGNMLNRLLTVTLKLYKKDGSVAEVKVLVDGSEIHSDNNGDNYRRGRYL